MSTTPLPREQVVELVTHMDNIIEQQCGSDGADASDLLAHDAAQRAVEAVLKDVKGLLQLIAITGDDIPKGYMVATAKAILARLEVQQ